MRYCYWLYLLVGKMRPVASFMTISVETEPFLRSFQSHSYVGFPQESYTCSLFCCWSSAHLHFSQPFSTQLQFVCFAHVGSQSVSEDYNRTLCTIPTWLLCPCSSACPWLSPLAWSATGRKPEGRGSCFHRVKMLPTKVYPRAVLSSKTSSDS